MCVSYMNITCSNVTRVVGDGVVILNAVLLTLMFRTGSESSWKSRNWKCKCCGSNFSLV